MRAPKSVLAAMSAAALLVVSAPALAAGGPSGTHPTHPTHPAHPTHSTSTPAAKAKAYGKACQGESHKRADAAPGTRGTPFSQCVTAAAHAAKAIKAGKQPNPHRLCAAQGLSRKHVKGEKGTPYSFCVSGIKGMIHA